MGKLTIQPHTNSITQVPNAFIDQFMAKANGSFVKIYLYLLRHANDDISTDHIADYMECTEGDVLRALRYWDKCGVLSYAEGDGQLTLHSLTANEFTVEQKPASTPTSVKEETPTILAATSEKVIPLPERHTYSPIQAEALQNDVEIKDALCVVETMMGTTLSEQHVQLILYLMSDLGFSSELVIFLYETSLSKEKRAPRYIEAIALNWAKKGITTIEQADAEASNYNTTYNIVSKNLGINRAFAAPEREVIDGWEKYHFTAAVLTEACKRTILQTNEPNLKYADSILESWHRSGVQTIADIEKLDKQHHMKKQGTPKPKASNNAFQNFPQRAYSAKDYSSLEKQLLRK